VAYVELALILSEESKNKAVVILAYLELRALVGCSNTLNHKSTDC